MENKQILKQSYVSNKILYIAGIILLAAFSRLIPHPPNFAPIAGIALFSGATLNKKIAFIIPLCAMLLSDIVLGFHSTMLYVYSSFFIIVLIGRLLKGRKKDVIYLFGASLFSSVLFFLITNFGVWISSGIYSKNINGLIQSYYMGIPFFRNTLIGDMIYTLGIFYGYEFSLVVGKKILAYIKS